MENLTKILKKIWQKFEENLTKIWKKDKKNFEENFKLEFEVDKIKSKICSGWKVK